MLKKNKTTLIVTSLVMLLPMVLGLLLWNQLPDQIPSHWGIDGEIDGWSSKTFAVFGFPCILFAVHWICVFASQTDPKSKDYHPSTIRLVLWICPVLSLVLNSLVYTAALGYSLNVEVIMPLLVGLMFIIVGNLLPKCRQSYTMGIKLPWTLANEKKLEQNPSLWWKALGRRRCGHPGNCLPGQFLDSDGDPCCDGHSAYRIFLPLLPQARERRTS